MGDNRSIPHRMPVLEDTLLGILVGVLAYHSDVINKTKIIDVIESDDNIPTLTIYDADETPIILIEIVAIDLTREIGENDEKIDQITT